MAKKKRPKQRVSELTELKLSFQNNPEELSKEQRERLRQLLLEKRGKKRLKANEQVILDQLNRTAFTRRKFLLALGSSIPIAGLGLLLIKKNCDKKPSQNTKGTTSPKTPERLNNRAEAERLAILTDEQVGMLKEIFEKWQALYNEKKDFVVHPQAKKILGETIEFLLRQLNQSDNNHWRFILREPKIDEEKIEIEMKSLRTRKFLVTGNRVANVNRYNEVNFAFTDDPKSITTMATYFAPAATIASGFLINYAPKFASLIMLHEAKHAIDHRDNHRRIEKMEGRSLSVDEHFNIDATIQKHNPDLLLDELRAYSVEFEMANILANNELRKKVLAGGTIDDKDFLKYCIGDKLNLPKNFQLDQKSYKKIIDMMNIYFKVGSDLGKHQKEYDEFMEILKTIY